MADIGSTSPTIVDIVASKGSHFIKNDLLRAGISSSIGGFVAGCLGIFAGINCEIYDVV